jgi:hypothetical protein
VSKEVGVKYCTCRAIAKQFLKEGSLEKKKQRRRRGMIQTVINLKIHEPYPSEVLTLKTT